MRTTAENGIVSVVGTRSLSTANSMTRPALLHAFVARGPKAGTLLFPHEHRDGGFVVSMTRFERDYIRVPDAGELMKWLEKGYRLRMSNKEGGVASPSLVAPEKIYRPVILKGVQSDQ